MATLREKVMALTDDDLARLVMVTAQALNDQKWAAEIAELCDIPNSERRVRGLVGSRGLD